MNAGTFKKGEKRPRQGKRGPGKVTVQTREAITAFTDGNAHKLQSWLDAIEKKDGARAAFDAYKGLLEFTIPKMQRTQVTGDGGGVNVSIVRWADSPE